MSYCIRGDINLKWSSSGNCSGTTTVYSGSLKYALIRTVSQPISLATLRIQKYLRPVKDPDDIVKLQKDLIAINKWADENEMQFNADKFQAHAFGPQTDRNRNTHVQETVKIGA